MGVVMITTEELSALREKAARLESLRADLYEGGTTLKQIFERLRFLDLMEAAAAGKEVTKRQFANKLIGVGRDLVFGGLHLDDLLTPDRIGVLVRIIAESDTKTEQA